MDRLLPGASLLKDGNMKKIFLTMMLVLIALGAVAKKKPEATYGKGTQKVYLFGVSQQLADSVVYITFINEVDSMALENKTKFLPFRSEFSLQMKEYLEGTLKLNHQTTCVFFSLSRKSISKKYYKIKKRFLDNPDTKIVPLEGFKFKNPWDAYGAEE